jgi:hypothetical protein
MKVSKVVFTFYFILFFSSIEGLKFHQEIDYSERASSFVKTLVDDFNKKNSLTHDIVILKLEQYENSKRLVNEIFEKTIQKLSEKNTVILPSINTLWTSRDMRKAEITIIVSDAYNSVSNVINLKLSLYLLKNKSVETNVKPAPLAADCV